MAFRARRVDANWQYQKGISQPITGFNPFRSEIYYSPTSCFSHWLKAPEASARDFNPDDHLTRELMFAVHDYLHVLSFHAIQQFQPELGFGLAEISPKNLEKFVFCHLVTEAAAVIGLDYWFLSTVDINRICDVGTRFRTLTVTYFEEDLEEYRRFFPAFQVQTPAFFRELVRFYCTGEFVGFDIHDFRRSPKLAHWLFHELEYGVKQREYAREWFAHLSGKSIRLPKKDAPVACDEPWQEKLICQMADWLWGLVKLGQVHSLQKIDPASTWKAPRSRKPDFRFTNLNSLNPGQQEKVTLARMAASSFELYAHQLVSQFDFESFEPSQFAALTKAIENRNLPALRKILGKLRPLDFVEPEPADIFLLP